MSDDAILDPGAINAAPPTESTDPPATSAPGSDTILDVTPTPPQYSEDAWQMALPDDLRANPMFANYATPQDLAKSFVEMSGRTIPTLSETPTNEELTGYFKAIGRPESPDGYTLKVPEVQDDTLKKSMDDKFVKEFKEACFEAGLSPMQAQLQLDLWTKKLEQEATQSAEATKTQLGALRAEHRAALQADFPGAKYEVLVASAKKGLTFALQECPELAELLNTAPGLQTHPGMVKLMNVIGQQFSEHAFHGGGNPGTGSEAAKQALETFKNDPEKSAILADRSHRQYKAVTQELKALTTAAYPTK